MFSRLVSRYNGTISRRAVSNRPLELSVLSLGCAQLGNLHREVSDAEANATVEAAWDLGVRYYDTAPHYGLGLSERRLGPALGAHARDDYILSSKVGRLLEPVGGAARGWDEDFAVPATHRRVWDFSRDAIHRSIDESLGRLGLDRLDVVYLHDPDDHMAEAVDTGYPALDELRSEGVVTAIGAGMNSASSLAELVSRTDLDLVMLAGRYTLLEQDSLDDLLPLCVRRRVAVVAAGVFNSGLLAQPHPADDCELQLRAGTARARSSGRARSQPSASATARRCRPRRSPSRLPTPRSSVSASARSRPSRYAGTRRSSPSPSRRISGASSGRSGSCARTLPCRIGGSQ